MIMVVGATDAAELAALRQQVTALSVENVALDARLLELSATVTTPLASFMEHVTDAVLIARDEERDAIAGWIELGAASLGLLGNPEQQEVLEELVSQIRDGLYRAPLQECEP